MGLPSKKLQAYLKPGCYPVVKIPHEYTEALGPKVQPPVAPQEPLPPKRPVLKKMPEPKPPKRTAMSWLGLDSDYILENHLYKKAVEDRPTLNKHFKEMYEAENKAYARTAENYKEVALPEYEKEYAIYQELLTLTRSHMNDTNSRGKLLALRMQNATRPSLHSGSIAAVRGLSELYFEGYLKNRYKDALLPHYTTIVSDENQFQRPYIPDFVLSFDDNSLIIDIEIDEHYVSSSHQPIHFLKDLNEKKREYSRNFVDAHLRHVDETRDAFFLESGWIVIRFTEKQVINSPFLCVGLIDLVIEYLKQVPPNLAHPTSDVMIESEKMWTKWMAVNLANQGYRQSYLPPKLSQAAADARKLYLSSRHHPFDDDNDLPF